MINYSFIIPHHNSPELLNRCLDSIPQREDIQIIVVDDNSMDDKRPNVRRQDVEIIYIDAEHTKGAGHARNEGLAQAKGKWLLFPDCDDFYSKNLIEVLDSYKNKDIDVLYFNFEFRDGKTGTLLPSLPFASFWGEYDGSRITQDQIKFHHNVPWTKMVSHKFVELNNIKFEEVPNGNDILFSMLVGYYATNIEIEKKALYVYLQNENSILTKKKTINEHLCKLIHRVKQNRFYEYIGHPEWKVSILKVLLQHVRQSGVRLLVSFVLNLPLIYFNRNEWIKLLTEVSHPFKGGFKS